MGPGAGEKTKGEGKNGFLGQQINEIVLKSMCWNLDPKKNHFVLLKYVLAQFFLFLDCCYLIKTTFKKCKIQELGTLPPRTIILKSYIGAFCCFRSPSFLKQKFPSLNNRQTFLSSFSGRPQGLSIDDWGWKKAEGIFNLYGPKGEKSTCDWLQESGVSNVGPRHPRSFESYSTNKRDKYLHLMRL